MAPSGANPGGEPAKGSAVAGTSNPPPPPAPAADASPTPEAGASAASEEEDDMFVPLTTPSAPPRKAAPARASKKGARSKEAVELQREWNGTRSAYDALTREQSCESPRIGIICRRFSEVKAEMENLGDGYKKDLSNKVKKLRRDLEKQLNSGQ